MTLLALLFALVCERGLTHLMHLREWRWLDPWFDMVDTALGARRDTAVLLVAIVLVTLPVVPVALLSYWLGGRLIGLAQFGLAVVVLLLALGPRDLKDEVDDYVGALERSDAEEVARLGKELLESNVSAAQGAEAREAIEDAIFIQANNRMFGVVFWFAVAGVAGAWAFRVSDMLRRRAAFEAARRGVARGHHDLGSRLADVHGVLAWAPARLAALTYALAGSFEDAVGNWRTAVDRGAGAILDRAEDLLARVGKGSLQPSLATVPPQQIDVARARGAWRIVSRSLWIWVAVIAVLVLAGIID